ncbi:trypsin-like peptidase domain-containing protein [Candidatus Woesearchaeota archaeon]|nr:trypsin-like peptidase domain-containing protein [Candidatus Woesearchaeota archaeon]
MIKKNIQISIAILSALLVVGGLIFYFNYSLNIARQDYSEKIAGLSQKTEDDFKAVKSDISSLSSNISAQLALLNNAFDSFKKQNEQDLKTLSSLIEQIEKQSNIRLDELKGEVKNIRIKSADFSAIVDDVLRSVVSISTDKGQGSGVIIDPKGYIITNIHVINGASAIKVHTYSDDKYDVNEIAGYDLNADIVVLKIDASDLKGLNFGDSDGLKVGEKVIAAGNPAGLSFTVTEGIISAFRTFNSLDYLQIDVPINPGNSGGPLVNTKGEIVGINNFKVGGFESLGFAISSNDVRSVASKAISDYEAKQKQ